MAPTADTLTTRVVVRKLLLTGIGVALFVASLTVVFEAMRSVMDVGGYCASGGPYQIRQECPGGTWLLPVGIFTGLIGVGLVVAGTFGGGPVLWTLAWPALFLALGWNFLRYAIDPPPPDDGLVWGWLVCAVAFLAIGGLPLLVILGNARAVLWGKDDGSARRRRRAPAPDRTAHGPTRSPAVAVPFGSTTVPASAGTPTPPTLPTAPTPPTDGVVAAPDADDLLSDLERLAALHRSGALSDAEFDTLKSHRLAEEGS
jgi:hypothetical protein